MNIDVLNTEGSSTGRKIDLDENIFGIEPSEHSVYLVIKAYNAAQRQGTHSAKERNAVKGSTRKIKKQKGTGTARAGDIKNPIFRGGGRIFGPRPRNYNIKVNKKVRTLAKKSALSSMFNDGNVVIVEDFTFDAPKTKDFTQLLSNLDATNKKTLFITADKDQNIYLSGRNVKKSRVSSAIDYNIYDLLNAEKVVFTESAIDTVVKSFA